jgi:hypothetical protein
VFWTQVCIIWALRYPGPIARDGQIKKLHFLLIVPPFKNDTVLIRFVLKPSCYFSLNEMATTQVGSAIGIEVNILDPDPHCSKTFTFCLLVTVPGRKKHQLFEPWTKYEKTPNPKCRLFLKIDQQTYLAACVYLSEAPDPFPRNTLYEYMYPCTYSHWEGGGGRVR